uniref:Regulatory protein zeste n=1 Tax=Romanomermis culicivorax TaxID=13658 RepID=A0A915JPU6_ROMCU
MDVKCEKARLLTGEQCAVLIEQVENSKGVLFSKDGKSGMVRRKNEAWALVASNVNALRSSGQARTINQIKKCWENISSKSQKEIGKKKKKASVTGGGPLPADLTNQEKKIINIFGDNNPVFSGKPGGFDSLIPPNTAVMYLDLSSNDGLSPLAQQQSPKIHYEALTPVPL